MAGTLITQAQLTVIIDKLARFASETVGDPEFSNSFNAGMELASGNVPYRLRRYRHIPAYLER